MKKIGLVFVTILLALWAWNYFSRTGPISEASIAVEEKSAPPIENIKEKIETGEVQQPEIVIKNEIVPINDVEQKTAKALQNIQKRSRRPTGNVKVHPDMLIEHDSLSGTRWKIWSDVRAIRAQDVSANDVIIAELSHFALVEMPEAQSQLSEFDRNFLVVVYETRLKKPGLVTGLIKIETERKDLLDVALQDMNARIENAFEQIQTYYVSSRQKKFDLEKLYFNLKSLPFVKSAELDILYRGYEKK